MHLTMETVIKIKSHHKVHEEKEDVDSDLTLVHLRALGGNKNRSKHEKDAG